MSGEPGGLTIDYRYAGRSGMTGGAQDARLALATNQLREATFFRGTLGRPLLLREGMAALTAGCVLFRVRAAADTDPVNITSRNAASCLRFMSSVPASPKHITKIYRSKTN